MRKLRLVSGMLAVLMLFSVTGCGTTVNSESRQGEARQAPMERPAPRRQGMSTGKKVLLLAGAAALFYLYNKHKNRQSEGPDGRYYRSKNGRVYYRDLKTGKYQWVDPPQQPIEVPAEEYERYTGQRADGYEGRVIRDAPPGW